MWIKTTSKLIEIFMIAKIKFKH